MFQCGQCSYSSCRKYDLKRHERLKHGTLQTGSRALLSEKTIPRQCDQCSYSSSRKYDLKRHERLKHYPVQNGKGVKKDTDSLNSDDSDMEDLEKGWRNSKDW